MSYQALARKYRPQTFSDIIGQETTVRTLQNSIEQQRIHHGFLFSGVRGIGKTTTARIFAKALNCAKGPAAEPCNECTQCREITEGIDLDVREIDAATYTGVDNIRELREVTQFQPARDRYRIFIIDEAHMLSAPAWNALLKILEEPPPHVVFMFATTEVQKILPTILSRVQKFSLRKVTLEEVIERLAQICRAEGIEADRGALEIVARRGEGSVRDSLSLLDQIIAFSGRSITATEVGTVLGLSETGFFSRLVALIAEGDHAGILEAMQEASDAGRDVKMLYRDLLSFVRNLLLISGGASETLIAAAAEELAIMRDAAAGFSYSELLRIANLLLRDDEVVKEAEHQRLAVELALLKAATFPRLRAVEEVLSGAPAVSAPAPGDRAPRPSSSAAASRPAAQQTASQPGGTLADFTARVQKTRPLLAGYLSGAESSRRDGSKLVFTFSDEHLAQPLVEAQKALDEIARDVFGEPVAVAIETAKPRTADGAKQQASPPLKDDPVIQAFQKHLGGEIVDRNR